MLTSTLKPDFLLAEPVGSCTDLVATVLRPLKHFTRKPSRSARLPSSSTPSGPRRAQPEGSRESLRKGDIYLQDAADGGRRHRDQ